MKQKIILAITSIVVSLSLFELALRVLNFPPQLNKQFQRKDIVWTMQHVSLNSYGYRDKEYQQEKPNNAFRIYAVGDSYTYGWLIDDTKDTFLDIVEQDLNKKFSNVELINAATPGFTIKEEVGRFVNEGKFFYPDLVLIGINDDEANVSSTYFRPSDLVLPKFIRNLHLYQATVGNLIGKTYEKKNHEYIRSIYTNPDSKDWQDFAAYLLQLKENADQIGSKVAIVLFPHIHANNPNADYDFIEYNKKIKSFSDEHGIFFIDPLESFLKYKDKKDLVINPLDPHPTIQMNKIVSEEILKQFDFDSVVKEHKSLKPVRRIVEITQKNKPQNAFDRIVSIVSNKPGYPWVYFNTKNGNDTQTFPLIGMNFRQTTFHADYLETGKSFTHDGLPGAIMTYHTKPSEKDVIKIPKELYGYEVISLSYTLGLRVLSDGTTRGEYITPTSMKENDDYWEIKFDQKEDYQIYTHNLKVATRQLDIDESGKIQNIVQSLKLTVNLSQDTETVSIPLSTKAHIPIKINSWPNFNNFEDQSFSYAYVDGQMTKLKSAEVKDDMLVLLFPEVIQKGKNVSTFVSAQYPLDSDEILKIEVE